MPTDYEIIATDQDISTAAKALEENGFAVQVADNKQVAKDAVAKLIPPGSEVMTVTSVTLAELGLAELFNDSGQYQSIRTKLTALYGDPTKLKESKQIASAPDFVTGSVHAITLDGHLMIASATGSQLAPEVYGASKVVFVVGAKKIVKDIQAGFKRIDEHTVPLEYARALKAYGGHTSLNKILILFKERPERINIVIVKENLGF